MSVAAPSCLIQRHFLQLSATLAERCQQLQLELSDQVASLPVSYTHLTLPTTYSV